jgi:hypothetical protein
LNHQSLILSNEKLKQAGQQFDNGRMSHIYQSKYQNTVFNNTDDKGDSNQMAYNQQSKVAEEAK